MHEVLQSGRRARINPEVLGSMSACAGDNEQALVWLERAYAERSNGLTALKVHPVYDSLRSDPRFRRLLRRVGLAP